MVPISVNGQTGVDVGDSTRNLNYAMGLSDFFSFIFEDKETTNLMLEANAFTASEIYSDFLQKTSSLSLEDIQVSTGSAIKLLLIKESDAVTSDGITKYKLSIPIQSAKIASNRPFLPTEYLEYETDFYIEQEDISTSYIRFAKNISQYKFSQRLSSDGVLEYAVWLTDCVIDSQLIQNTFGAIIGVSPEKSSEAFSNFIYGLYFLYFNGPSLKRLDQGLNIALGVPMARETEQILDIRNYLDTDGYFVITPNNQYIVPAGAGLEVSIGDVIEVGQPLSRWIELKDFQTNGRWWDGVKIPEHIISILPSCQSSRFAITGSYFDWIMTNYLYKNTFLVVVYVDRVRQSIYYDRVVETLKKVKPAYTQAIFSYKVDMDEDVFEADDEGGFTVSEESTAVTTINSDGINDAPIN